MSVHPVDGRDRADRRRRCSVAVADDVTDAVLFAMTNSFLTGVTLKVDGGEPLT